MENKDNIPSFIRTNNSLVISYRNGQIFTLIKGNKNYDLAFELLKQRDYEKLRGILSPIYKFLDYTGGKLFIKEDKIYLEGDDRPIPDVLGKKIIEFSEENLPFEALVNFWKKIKSNPSNHSIEQLYSFLERNHLPITPDGNLIAFKGVIKSSHVEQDEENLSLINKYKDKIYFSEHKDENGKRVPNILGKTVSMPREKVVSNPQSHCSYGLHVGSYQYASTFVGGGRGETLEIEVNPMNVVSVPNDCNCQKIRVCEYTVIGLVRKELVSEIILKPNYQDNEVEDETGAESEVKVEKKEIVNSDILESLIDWLIEHDEEDEVSDYSEEQILGFSWSDIGFDEDQISSVLDEASFEYDINIDEAEFSNCSNFEEVVKLIENSIEHQQGEEDAEMDAEYLDDESELDEEDDSQTDTEDIDYKIYTSNENHKVMYDSKKAAYTINKDDTAKMIIKKALDSVGKILSKDDFKTLENIMNNKNSLKNKKTVIQKVKKVLSSYGIVVRE